MQQTPFNYLLKQNISNNTLNQSSMILLNNNQFKPVERIFVEKDVNVNENLKEMLDRKANQLNKHETVAKGLYGNNSHKVEKYTKNNQEFKHTHQVIKENEVKYVKNPEMENKNQEPKKKIDLGL